MAASPQKLTPPPKKNLEIKSVENKTEGREIEGVDVENEGVDS